MMKSGLFVFFLFVLLGKPAFAMQCDFPTKMVFSQILNNGAQTAASKILKQVYENLNICFEVVNLPGNRALELSNSGKTDGEIVRIWDIGVDYPELVRIPTPVMTLYGNAYSKPPLVLEHLDDLKGRKVGFTRGIKWPEVFLENVINAKFDNNEDLFEKFIEGSLDVILTTGYEFLVETRKLGMSPKYYSEITLTQFDVYHYVNKKHKPLVDQIDTELKKLLDAKSATQ